MAKPEDVTEADFEAKVVKGTLPALVDFWAVWCGPCRMVGPIVDELAEELDGKMNFFKVDVDTNPAIAEKFGIQSIPTLLIFRDGQLVKQLVGYMPKPQLKQALAEAGIA